MSDEGRPETPRAEPIVNAPIVAVLLAVALPALYWLQLRLPNDGMELAFSPARFWQGDPRGLVSAIFLHGSWPHVAMNAVALLAFGAPVARLLRGPAGALGFLAFFIVCGVIGSIGFAVVHPNSPGPMVGASGGVFGLIGGALRMATPRGPILPLKDRRVVMQALAWAGISVFVGVIGLGAGGGARIAWEAHLAGLAAGLLLIGPFVRLFPNPRRI